MTTYIDVGYVPLGDNRFREHYFERGAERTLCDKEWVHALQPIRLNNPGVEVCGECARIEVEMAAERTRPNVVLRDGPLDGRIGYVERPNDRHMLRCGLRLYGYVPTGEVVDGDLPLVVLVHDGRSQIAPTDG